MEIQLRDYQQDAGKRITQAIMEGKHRILFNMATGAGKTVSMSDFAKRVAERGFKTLIIVDRTELLGQTIRFADKDFPFGYLTADSFRPQDITVAMLQTLRARLKSELYQEWLSEFDFIFFDEIHQYYNGTAFERICDFKKDSCVVIGVTATPWDNKGYLLSGFEEFINGADIITLIEKGYLVKPEHYTIDLFDFSKVRVTSTGDYDTGAIDDIVVDTDKVDKVLEGWLTHAKHKKTIVFCSTVASAEHYAKFFRLNGVKAAHVSAQNSDTERANILAKFKTGEIECLFNVGLLVAGFDEPSIECVMFLNPTKILRRYIQCAGRGLRLCPEIGKTKCIFLDFVGNSFRHLEVDAIRSYINPPEKEVVCDEIECPVCGFVFPVSEGECPECGFKLDFDIDSEGGGRPPKPKKEFEKLIKLKSVQKELHDTIHEFVGLPCLVRIEDTGKKTEKGTPIRKWCYGVREDGSFVFKGDPDFTHEKYPYPMIRTAKKTNCWYVFHTICIKFDPKQGALRYYGRKLRKAKKFLEQIKNPNNRAFVDLYKIMDN